MTAWCRRFGTRLGDGAWIIVGGGMAYIRTNGYERVGGCGRFLGVVSYTASPWLVLYSTGLFQPSDCLILGRTSGCIRRRGRRPPRTCVPPNARRCTDPVLHTAEEPLGRGVVGAAPLRAHGPDQAVPAHPFQPSRDKARYSLIQ